MHQVEIVAMTLDGKNCYSDKRRVSSGENSERSVLIGRMRELIEIRQQGNYKDDDVNLVSSQSGETGVSIDDGLLVGREKERNLVMTVDRARYGELISTLEADRKRRQL